LKKAERHKNIVSGNSPLWPDGLNLD